MLAFPAFPIRLCGAALLALAVFAASAVDAARQPDRDVRHSSIAGRLLVAAPELEDPNFRGTVVYMIHHDRTGAMGLVVNRVLGAGPLANLLEDFEIEGEALDGAEITVHYGGPVEQHRGFVLHSRDYDSAATVVLSEFAALTSSLDILKDMAAGRGPERSLFALGYAGWAPDQLDAELAAGAWLVVEADEGLLFDPDAESKWQRAFDRHGIDL